LSVKYFNRLYEEFGEHVDFLMIYISEAHAIDEWKLGTIVNITQHKTIEERISVAKDFIQEYGWNIPTVVDTFYSETYRSFESNYSAWPERYFVLSGGIVSVAGAASNEYGFDRLGLKRTLRNYIPDNKRSLLQSDFNIYSEADDAICVHSDNTYNFTGDETPFVPAVQI